MPTSPFPAGLLWEAATSGYRIEGGAKAERKGASIWDRFAHRPVRVLHGDTGDRACDVFHPARQRGDLDLMAELGLKALLLSHGLALQRLREVRGVRVGLVLNVTPYRPASPSARDRAATRRLDGEQNRLFLDPLFDGHYPADVVRVWLAPATVSSVSASEIWRSSVHRSTSLASTTTRRAASPLTGTARRGPKTAMDWAIDPHGLGEVLRRLRTEYTGEFR